MITKQARQRAANMMAQRQGLSTTQAGVDALWSGIVGKLNAALPKTQEPVGAARTSPSGGAKPTQESVDSMWAGLARNLNAEAGLSTPVQDRAR
jgi:hypothetical protein